MGISDRNMSKVALGPFSFTRTPDGIALLSANPRFTDPGSVQLDGIRLSAQSEAGIALQRFKRDRAGVFMGGTTGDFKLARAAALARFLPPDPLPGPSGYQPLQH